MNQEANQSSYIYIAEEDSPKKYDKNSEKLKVQYAEESRNQQTFRPVKSLELASMQRANQQQILDRLKKLNQIKEVQEKQKQKVKMRRYDYLNKYNMHQMSEMIYQNQQKIKQIKQMKEEKQILPQKAKQQSRLKRYIGESLDYKNAKTGEIYFSKQNTKRNSLDKQISSSVKKRRNKSPPYFAYLQAYQNNVKQCMDFHFPQQIIINHSPTRYSQLTQSLVTLGQTHDSASISNLLSRVPSFSNGLTKQISYQNQILRGQTNEYKAIVAKLQIDLKATRDELIITKQSLLKERSEYQKIIGSLQQSNRILESYKQKFQKLNKQLLQINLSQMKIKMVDSYFQNKQNLESCNKLKMKAQNNQISQQRIKNKQKQNHECLNIYTQFLQRLQQLFNKSNKNQNSFNPNMNPHNKIEQIMDKVEKVLLKHKRYEQFVYNIVEMYKKIQKTPKNIDISYQLSKTLQYGEPSLKQIWKWLKQLGYTYNLIQQIKPLMIKKLGIDESQNKDLKVLLENVVLKI